MTNSKQIVRLGIGLVAAGLFALAGCGGGGLNTDKLGDMLGGSTGQMVKAAGHEKNALTLSEKDEDGIGQGVGVTLCNQYGVYDRPAMLKYVTLVGLTVASASPNPGGNYVFGILDTETINAFSGPNGYVFITRGALEHMQDEAELAGVLAHEISHVCHHDGLHQVQMAEQQGALSDAIASQDKMQQFSALTDAGVDAITKTGYTQPQEFAADDSGVKIMSAAGYDPRSYLRFLQRLQTLAAGGGGVMSTHPGIKDRVSRVSKEISTMKNLGTATLKERFAANVNFVSAG